MTNLIITKEEGWFYLWVDDDLLARYATESEAIERAERYKEYSLRPEKCTITVNLSAK